MHGSPHIEEPARAHSGIYPAQLEPSPVPGAEQFAPPPAGRRTQAAVLRGWLTPPAPCGVVQGPDGAGRTSLLRWLVDDARACGGHGLLVTGTDPVLEPPLGVWSRLAVAAARAGLAVPDLLLRPGQRREPDSSGLKRHALSLRLLDLLATGRSVVVVDDADRADTASLELLVQLCAAPDLLPVLVVVSMRSPEQHPDERGRRALRWLAASDRQLYLDLLGPDAIVEVVVDRYGEATRGWVAGAAPDLQRLTHGVPTVLTQLLDSLGVGAGRRPSLPASAEDVDWTPQIVREVAARIGRLDDDVWEALRAIVVADGNLDASRVGAVLGGPVDRELTTLIDCGWVRADERGRLQATHPLVRRSVTDPADTDLRLLHRSIATVLRVLPRDGRDELAALHHLLAAGDLVAPEVLAAAVDAVLRTSDSTADADQEAAVLGALWATAGHDAAHQRWHAIGHRLAAAHHRAGHYEQAWEVARTVLLHCLDRPSPAEHDELAGHAVEVARLLATGRIASVRDVPTSRLFLRLSRWLPQDDPWQAWAVARAGLLRLRQPVVSSEPPADDIAEFVVEPVPAAATDPAAVLAWEVRVEQAAELVEEAEAMLARLQHRDPDAARRIDPDITATIDLAWAEVHRGPEHEEQRARRLDQVVRSADDPQLRCVAASIEAVDRLAAADRRRCESAIATVVRDDPSGVAAAGLRSMLALASGDLADAERSAMDAFHLAEGDPEPTRWWRRTIQISAARLAADGPSEPLPPGMLAQLAKFPAVAAGIGWAQSLGVVFPGTPVVDPSTLLDWYLDGHVHAGVRPLFLALLGDQVWTLRRGALQGHGAAGPPEAAISDELVATLAAELTRDEHLIAVEPMGTYCHGAVARPLAGLRWLLGDRDGALSAQHTAARLERAAGLHRFTLIGAFDAAWRAGLDARPAPTGSAPPGTATGLLGRHEQRWTQLREIADAASQRGLAPLEREARSLMLAEATAGLTVRQVEVLRQLTTRAGLPVIAARLGYSQGTIRREVLTIYRRLEVDGRRGAAGIAEAIGLVPEQDADGA